MRNADLLGGRQGPDRRSHSYLHPFSTTNYAVVPELSAEERQDLSEPGSRADAPPVRAAPLSNPASAGSELLDQDQRRLLQVTFNAFLRESSWPELDDVQRELDLRAEDFEVESVGGTVSEAYARIAWGPGGRFVKLRVRGVAQCEGATEEVLRFLKAVRLFVQKQVARERVTPSVLGSAIGAADERAIRRTYLLLESETQFLGGGTGGVDDEWERDALPRLAPVPEGHHVGGVPREG